MSEPSAPDPTGRFTGLADLYARHRPDYPPAALDFLQQRTGLGPGALLVDVGCGTGISSRLFARRGVRVVGLEPNDEMRAKAEAVPTPEGLPVPAYRAGRAEETGLDNGCADVVLAAQAFHWFDPGRALGEFYRVLRPGGWVALVWNERDDRDPFTAEYSALLRSNPEAVAVENERWRAGEPLLTHPLFRDARCDRFEHEQRLDEDGLLGRAFSASYAPREPARAEMLRNGLRELFRRAQREGTVVLRYETSVYTAQRREG